MAPGMVSEGFLVDSPECLPLILHGLLWYFPNNQATQWGVFMTLVIFMGIITLLDNLSRYLKLRWFSLWQQTRSYLLSHNKRSSVDHSLAMSYLVISDPTTYL